MNTGRGSDIIVLIEAGGFYSRKYGNLTSMFVIGYKVVLRPQVTVLVSNI